VERDSFCRVIQRICRLPQLFYTCCQEDDRGELASALQAITAYLRHFALTPETALVRLDGQYGDAAVIAQLIEAGVHLVTRGKGYQILEHPQIQRALAHPPTRIHMKSGYNILNWLKMSILLLCISILSDSASPSILLSNLWIRPINSSGQLSPANPSYIRSVSGRLSSPKRDGRTLEFAENVLKT